MQNQTMKAVFSTGYGAPEVLEIREVERPTPNLNEILVKVMASALTTADAMMRTGTPRFARLFLGLRKPNHPIPGTGFAGIVEAVGAEVKQFRPGDAVFGETTFGFGANAEFLCIAEDGVILHKPDTMTFEEAAPVCDGALTSFNFLKILAKVQAGQKVLINGASGSLGTAAVQLAKHFGAEVTGVCSSKNVGLVRSLGADHVIDYKKKDFTHNHAAYDIIYDTIGGRTFRQAKPALKEGGIYLSPVLKIPLLFQMLWTSWFGKKRALFEATGLKPEKELRRLLQELKDLFEKGLLKSVQDRSYGIEEVVEAHQYIDSGRKRGNVVMRLA